MARSQLITCDVCGAQKREVNHWFLIGTTTNGDSRLWGVFIRKSEDWKEKFVEAFDLCGESCVIKKVSELIGAHKTT